MIKILFICHGNICRSPMAEFIFKDMLQKIGKETDFFVASSATSTEEIGNPVHAGTKKKLNENGIKCEGKRAIHLKKEDYAAYDYLIGMEQRNVANILRIVGQDSEKKVSCLMDFTKKKRDIADPWYTGDFDLTYRDVTEGCLSLLEYLTAEGKRAW